MDMELHAAVMDLIGSLDPGHNLPRSELRKIAEDTIAEDKVTDGEWLYQRIQQSRKEFRRKRNIAHVRGYAPFCSLNQRVYNKLLEAFGEDVLGLMRKYLADPEDIYSKWAYRFASTVIRIGLKECLQHKEEVYSFVTGHSLWKQNQEHFLENYRNWIADGQPRPDEPLSETAAGRGVEGEASGKTGSDQDQLSSTCVISEGPASE